MKTKNIDLKKRFMILLIAPTGSGKTCAAASFHKLGPMKFYDFDGRMNPVKKVFPDADIDYDTYSQKNIDQFCDEFDDLLTSCKWKTIVIDSITSLTLSIVTYQLRMKGLGGKVKMSKGGIVTTSWDEINGETTQMSVILDAAKALPCNVIFTAHPVKKTTIVEGEKPIISMETVAYGPKIGSIIPSYFNEVHSIGIGKPINDKSPTPRYVYTGEREQFGCKTALPIPAKIDITHRTYYEALIQEIDKYYAGKESEMVKEIVPAGALPKP